MFYRSIFFLFYAVLMFILHEQILNFLSGSEINHILILISYCECFAAGVYCIEPCSCQDCFNKPVHEDTVLQTRKQIESRNPLAFAPKVIRSADSVPEIGVRR